MIDLCGKKHSQVGSLAGAAHLLNDNAGVLRWAQLEQTSHVDQKEKKLAWFSFFIANTNCECSKVEGKTMKVVGPSTRWVFSCWVKLCRRLHSWWCPSVNSFKFQPYDHTPSRTPKLWFLTRCRSSHKANDNPRPRRYQIVFDPLNFRSWSIKNILGKCFRNGSSSINPRISPLTIKYECVPTIPINHYLWYTNQQSRPRVLSYYSMLMYSSEARAWNTLISLN